MSGVPTTPEQIAHRLVHDWDEHGACYTFKPHEADQLEREALRVIIEAEARGAAQERKRRASAESPEELARRFCAYRDNRYHQQDRTCAHCAAIAAAIRADRER